MRFVPALRLSLVLSLPTTANAKGRHLGSSHAHSPDHITSNSSSAVPRDFYGLNSITRVTPSGRPSLSDHPRLISAVLILLLATMCFQTPVMAASVSDAAGLRTAPLTAAANDKDDVSVLTAESKGISVFEEGRLMKSGNLNVIVLRGSYRQMGQQEGRLLKKQLEQLYQIAVLETYVKEVGMKLEDIMAASKEIFDLYPKRFQDIIFGMAETSGLKLEQLVALDQIYVLPKLSGTDVHCSAIAVWGDYTGGGPLVFGRNFDYPEYFKKFNPYLTVIVYQPDDGVPTAVVGYPGGVSAMHGLNKQGLFVELNDGTTSGGKVTVSNRIVPLLFPVTVLFDSSTIVQLDAALNTTRCSVAMIINAADTSSAFAYECSVSDTIKRLPDKAGLLVETNHFMAPAWKMAPTEGGEWLSFTRYKNLIALADRNKGNFNARLMMAVLDTPIEKGGATRPAWAVQQLVVVPAELKIWIKAPGWPEWNEVDLKKYF